MGKIAILVLSCFTLSILIAASCDKSKTASDIPNCIQEKIKAISEEDPWNPPAKVYSYQYKDQEVYYFTAPCCDNFSELYDSNCTLICHPDGGFTGKGDGKCIDFTTTRSNEKLIWEDLRRRD